MGSDPEGPLCELLFFFLSAIFQALDEEQEEMAKDQAEGQTHTQAGFSVLVRTLNNMRSVTSKTNPNP